MLPSGFFADAMTRLSGYPNAAEGTRTPAHLQDAKCKRILVVEDNPLSLTLLKQLLKAHGYDLSGSPDGLQALDLARDEQPDLILMDIRLPDISGLEVTRLLKQDYRTKTIPIIAVTALVSPEYEKKGLESGCDAYIPMLAANTSHHRRRATAQTDNPRQFSADN